MHTRGFAAVACNEYKYFLKCTKTEKEEFITPPDNLGQFHIFFTTGSFQNKVEYKSHTIPVESNGSGRVSELKHGSSEIIHKEKI